jgi:hypothetical protein
MQEQTGAGKELSNQSALLYSDLTLRLFALLGRLDRFVIKDYNFEGASRFRRLFPNVTASIDYTVLSLPLCRNLAEQAVIYGHAKK